MDLYESLPLKKEVELFVAPALQPHFLRVLSEEIIRVEISPQTDGIVSMEFYIDGDQNSALLQKLTQVFSSRN